MTETTTDTQTMTPEQLAEIEARTNAATPGPWWAWDRGVGYHIATGEPDERGRPRELLPEGFRTDIGDRHDAEFIAHAREDVPALLAEVKRLQTKLDQPCGSCHPCSNYADETWREADRKPPHVYQWDGLRDDLAEIERLAYMGGQDAETIRRAILAVFEKRDRIMTAVLSRARAALACRVRIQWPACCPHPDMSDDFPEETSNG